MAICRDCKKDTRYCTCGRRRNDDDYVSPIVVYTPDYSTPTDSGCGGDCGCGGCD